MKIIEESRPIPNDPPHPQDPAWQAKDWSRGQLQSWQEMLLMAALGTATSYLVNFCLERALGRHA